MKKLILLLGVLILSLLLIMGCTPIDPYSNPSEVSSKEALKICNNEAKKCSEGIPVIESEFKQACWQIYYYTGDSEEILDFAKGLC